MACDHPGDCRAAALGDIQERQHALARLDAEPVVGETRGGPRVTNILWFDNHPSDVPTGFRARIHDERNLSHVPPLCVMAQRDARHG